MKFRSHPVLAALLCAAQLALFAPPAPAAEAAGPARVSVAYAGTPLKDALRQFQEQSGLRLAYAEDLLVGAAPVTLKRENAPAERVLREILRPQGLEAVMTDKNLAAVVPAWSDLGMAKAFGRALDIGLRLGNKLDGATVEGDEVKVPGWTAEDDEELALGITDLIVSIAYFAENRPRSMTMMNGVPVGQDEYVKAIQALLDSTDPAVRAGALLPLLSDGASRASRLAAYFSSDIAQGLADPHPVVRSASAILFAAILEDGQWLRGKSSPDEAAAMLRKLAADPEAGVRMAAVMALAVKTCAGDQIDRSFDPEGKMLDAFLTDRSAFVRQTPRVLAMAESRMIERKMPEGPAKAKWLALNADDGLKATLRDPNPIARAVGFAFAQIMQLEQRGRDKTAPRDRIAEIWTEAELAKDPWMKTVHGLIAPALAGDYQVALEKTVAAAGSDKPSHQAAALLSLGLGSTLFGRGMPQATARGEKPAPPKIPDLAPLVARLASSKWLWGKLSGIALDAALPFAGPMSAKPLPPEALKAAADRQQAALRDPSEPVRLVALFAVGYKAKAGVPCPPEPLLAALRSRTPAEAQLGVLFAGESLAPESLLKEIESLLADPSRRGATGSLLRNVWMNTALRKQTPDARLAFATKLFDRVVAAQDSALEAALYERIRYFENGEQQKAFTNLVLTKGSLAALAATPAHVFNILEAEARILFDRLKAEAADPAKRTVVLAVWTAQADRLQMMLNRENPAAVLSLLDQAMAGEPADVREAAARLRALPTLLSLRGQIERLPANPAKALEQALASAGVPAPSADAVALLVATVNHVNRSTMVKNGKKSIEPLDAWKANHPTLIQALDGAVRKVLAGTSEDDKVQVWCALARSGDKPAVAALTERILDGRVPDQRLPGVMNTAAANPDLMPPEFAPALFKLIRDPAQSLDRRCALIKGLNMCPNYSRRLAGEIEALAWDEKREPKLRSAAMSFLVSNSAKEAVPALIQKVLKGYDTLPVEMAEQLGSLACNRLATPGAEDLLVRVIEDKRLRGENGGRTFQLLFPRLSSEVDQLKAPDRLRQALDKLEKEWPAERRNEFENYMLPHYLQELRQKLDQLKPATPAQPAGAGDF